MFSRETTLSKLFRRLLKTKRKEFALMERICSQEANRKSLKLSPLSRIFTKCIFSPYVFRRQISDDICCLLFFFNKLSLERSLCVKLEYWMSNNVAPDETAHIDLCCLQKLIIIACGSERVKLICFLHLSCRIYPKYLDTPTPEISEIWTSAIYYPILCLKLLDE